VAERKPFLLRLPPEVYDALQGWAAADLRSLNGQIEFLLRRALSEAGRRAPGGAGSGPRGGPLAGRPAEPRHPAKPGRGRAAKRRRAGGA
jgi:hypothetical protein